MWKIKSSKEKYSSRFVTLYDDELILPNGREITFSRLVLLNFVTILPLFSDKVIFVRNYRYPANNFFLELPSGIIEEDETPEACAHRELKEETGFTGNFTYIDWYYPSARSLQKAYIYYADIKNRGYPHRDYTENQQVEILPIKTVSTMFREGAFKHAPTLITLGLCQTILNKKR